MNDSGIMWHIEIGRTDPDCTERYSSESKIPLEWQLAVALHILHPYALYRLIAGIVSYLHECYDLSASDHTEAISDAETQFITAAEQIIMAWRDYGAKLADQTRRVRGDIDDNRQSGRSDE